MTEALYLFDHYLKEFDGTVVHAEDGAIVLDRTAFYPTGGGQPCDQGWLRWDGGQAFIHEVRKEGDDILHLTNDALPPVGARAHGDVDWNRRYETMRYHTALHVLCGVLWTEYGAQVTGNQSRGNSARMDFNLPGLNRELADKIEQQVNTAIARQAPVEIYQLPREEAFQIPDLIRTKINLLPEGISHVRIVDIKGIDLQADGGPHVANTREIGPLKITKIENKGKDNKRIEIVLA